MRVIKNAPLEHTCFLLLFFFFFLFNKVCGLLILDLINYFPNRAGPDQMLHTMGSDLGIIVCFFLF